HYADEAIISEAVGEPYLKGRDVRILLKGPDLCLGIAVRRNVELVGLVDQLSDPRTVNGCERPKVNRHVERTEIAFEVGGLGREISPEPFGPVLFIALAVLAGESSRLEVARREQSAGKERRI